MSVIKKLHKDGYLNIGQLFATDTVMEVIMGSVAYGASTENSSDMDIHGITVPPIEWVFPHVRGTYIPGFSDTPEKFEHFQQHHIEAYDKMYDVAIYGIVKFFTLASDNNPNVLDMLWVPDNCITHINDIGHHIRKNRRHFLHKGAYHRFRGYAHQQFKRLENSPRKDLVEKYGYDTKFAYHIVRLCLQAEQILEGGDMDFSQNAAFIKEVRTGSFKTVDELRDWYMRKEADLDKLYHESKIQYKADKKFLGDILLACLEMKYGSLEKVYNGLDSDAFRKLESIKQIVNS